MARLTKITDKSQIPAEHHAIFDAIVESRGAVGGGKYISFPRFSSIATASGYWLRLSSFRATNLCNKGATVRTRATFSLVLVARFTV